MTIARGVELFKHFKEARLLDVCVRHWPSGISAPDGVFVPGLGAHDWNHDGPVLARFAKFSVGDADAWGCLARCAVILVEQNNEGLALAHEGQTGFFRCQRGIAPAVLFIAYEGHAT